MKAKMVKGLAVFAVVGCMVGALAGCGVNTTSTVTKTESYTDADGKTVTTTTVKDNKTGETTTTEEVTDGTNKADEAEVEDDADLIKGTIAFTNDSDYEFQELYFVRNSMYGYGENLIKDDEPLANGETITFEDGFTHDKDVVFWDMKVVDTEGNSKEFTVNIAQANDQENINVTLKGPENLLSVDVR